MPVLEVRNLSVPGSVENADLTLRPGEIVGISGLIGSGRTELALALFGMRPDFPGSVRLAGREFTEDRSGRYCLRCRLCAGGPPDRGAIPDTIDRAQYHCHVD